MRALATVGFCLALAACAASRGPIGMGMFSGLTSPETPSAAAPALALAPSAPYEAAQFEPYASDAGPVVASVEAVSPEIAGNAGADAGAGTARPYKVHSRGEGAPEAYSAVGMASWYGPRFHGKPTANGEIFDSGEITAAHLSLPLPSYVRVTNLDNNRAITVRVNDRGPYVGDRLIDVSERTAKILGFRRSGLTRVKVEYVASAPLRANDTAMLLATYNGPPIDDSDTTRAVAYSEQNSGSAVASAMARLTTRVSVVDRILMAFDAADTAETN